ncbi:MAG: glycine cleavage system protein R [Acidobacteria bacterium]|jgi:glycine cleavage system regulatory protein|nr:glycine cleavage system protein R [Acidobacteriota bacterium]
MTDLVLTLIGPDRPGLVESLAKRVAAYGGNWLESRMAHLAGQFAGILRVEVAAESIPALEAALAELEAEGLRVVARGGSKSADTDRKAMELQLVGQDHPGIVRDVAQILLQHGVNVEELTTDHVSAPMSGGQLFSARARLHVPAGTDTEHLRRDLEKIADDLMVDLTLAQAVIGSRPSRR